MLRLLFLTLLLLSAGNVSAAEKVDVDAETESAPEENTDPDSRPDTAEDDAYTKAYEGCLNEADAKTKNAPNAETADTIYKDVFKKCMTSKGHDVPSESENVGSE